MLKNKTTIITHTGTEWSLIITPFLGLFNDAIELYVKQQDSKIILSDDGATLNNLKSVGCNISKSPKRKEVLDKILLNYGLHLKGDEIITKSSYNTFAQKILCFLSAIFEINDMYMLADNSVASIFKEDVQKHLDEQGIAYDDSVKRENYSADSWDSSSSYDSGSSSDNSSW